MNLKRKLFHILLQYMQILIYFLILSILQTVPSITVTEGAPTILTGLIPMIIISMFKDLLEDLKRRADDEVENT